MTGKNANAMNDLDKYAVTVFFVPVRGDRMTLTQLLELAGATEIETNPLTPSDPSGLAVCTWAGMTCRAYTFERSHHQILHIFFFRSSLLERLGPEPESCAAVPLEKDGALDLALSFTQACLALSPDVAFVAVRRGQGDPDWSLAFESAVLAWDADALVAERFGLLYLNEEIYPYATVSLKTRDQLPVGNGCLLFAGCGWDRWFGRSIVGETGRRRLQKSRREATPDA